MVYGKTEEMRAIDNSHFWRVIRKRETRDRDRSLPGKARRRARKAANKK